MTKHLLSFSPRNPANRVAFALALILVILALVMGDTVSASPAQVPSFLGLDPGEVVTFSCPVGTTMSATRINARSYRLACSNASGAATPTSAVPTVTPTSAVPTVTPTPIVPTVTPTPHAHDSAGWHAPGAHGGMTAHEHGDAAPSWLLAAGYTPSFDHSANTPNENAIAHKHQAMKGWAGRFNGVDWYGIFHLDFNPGGHVSRFHSYQLWLRDNTGAVSHMHGWLDFGEELNTGPNLIITCNVDNNTRPIMLVNKPGCTPRFENWYGNASSPGPDIGFNINPNYFAGGDPADPSTWMPTGGIRNLTRRIEFAYYGQWGGENLRGEFWTTQFGNVISGPTDPVCDGLREIEVGEKTYTFLCLKQTIATSLPNVEFPGNSVQRVFPGSGVVLPN